MTSQHHPVRIQGSRMIPVRCYYCNRFFQGVQPRLVDGSSLSQTLVDLQYCCRSIILSTRQALAREPRHEII